MLPLCDQAFATQLYENQQVTRAIAEACSQWTQDWADRTCPAKVKRAPEGTECDTSISVGTDLRWFSYCEERGVFGAQSLQWAQWANCQDPCTSYVVLSMGPGVRPHPWVIHGFLHVLNCGRAKRHGLIWITDTHICAPDGRCIMHAGDLNLINHFMNHEDSWASTGWSMTRMIWSMKLATGTLSKKMQSRNMAHRITM